MSGHHDHQHESPHRHGHHSHEAATPAEGDAAECPVMKGTVVSITEAEELGLVREADGRKYYLCCQTCVSLFEADPERYTAA